MDGRSWPGRRGDFGRPVPGGYRSESPRGGRLVAKSLETVTADPRTRTESIFSEVLAGIVHAERVSVESHFFDDLGADSLVMAHFCARVRKRADLSSVSMKEVYRHPTISSLATAVTDAAPLPASVPASVPASTEVATPTGALQYVLCGALQFLSVLGYFYLAALVFA